jgi:signal transduction histidine kinase
MKKTKLHNFIHIWVIVLMILIAVVLGTIKFYQSLQTQLFTERQSHLTEMTVKISDVIDVTIDTMQEKVKSAKTFVEESSINKENATEILNHLSDMLFVDNGVLMAMDDQGRYYSSEGRVGRWTEMSDLISTDTPPCIRDIMISGERKSCMVFFASLEEPMDLGDGSTKLSHVAIALPLESIREYLTISMFQDQCYTYLINHQGRRLYRQTFSKTFIEDFNVLSGLKEDEFIRGGTIDDLVSAVNNGESLCVEFREQSDGEHYFVSTVPVSSSDWTVLLFVPTKTLGVQSTEFMNAVIIYFVGIAVAGILIFTCLISVIMANRNAKKMMEQQERNNELLAQAAEEAKRANSAKSEFLSHMSHDIRTPINGILGMTSIAIKNRGNQERIDDCLRKINGAADHLLTLINDVLDMSSIENGKVVAAHKPMDIRTLLNNCCSIIDGQIAARDLNFKTTFDELKHPCVLGDELHLRQVFINILGNAVKFTPDGGTVEFRVTEQELEHQKVGYRFEFQDNGIGISEEFQKKIFEEFSQEEQNSRTTYQGTGLGMAISKKLVELMGGTIQLKSVMGEGSCFTVDLVFDIDDGYEERKIVCPDKKAELGGMRILLVEDNELNMEIADEILSDEGVIVTEAWNGEIALDLFEKSEPGSFELILMDVMMPVMNGYDATRAIRSCGHPDAKTIPIIAMTANAYREDIELALESGMNEHVAKPIDVNRLLSVLERYRSLGH